MNDRIIALSFDDWHIREWEAYLPTLASNCVRATFYVCLRYGGDTGKPFRASSLGSAYWRRLQSIQSAGHTIGFHTVNHAIMDFSRIGLDHPIFETEIKRGIAIMQDHGFHPEHFSCPGGKCNPWIMNVLLKTFRSIRIGGRYYADAITSQSDARTRPIFGSLDIMSFGSGMEDMNVDRLLEIGHGIVSLYAHNPDKYGVELSALYKAARKRGYAFLSMADITAL